MLAHARITSLLGLGIVMIYLIVVATMMASYYSNEDKSGVLDVQASAQLERLAQRDQFTERTMNEHCVPFPPEARLSSGLCVPLIAWVAPEAAGAQRLADALADCNHDIAHTTFMDDLTFPFDPPGWQRFSTGAVKAFSTAAGVGQAPAAPAGLYRMRPATIDSFLQTLAGTRPILVLRDPRDVAYDYYLTHHTYEYPTFEEYLRANFHHCNWAARSPGDYNNADPESDWITTTLYKISILDMAVNQGAIPPQFHVNTPHNPLYPERFEGWDYARVFLDWSAPTAVLYEADSFTFAGKHCALYPPLPTYPAMSEKARRLLTRMYQPSVQALVHHLHRTDSPLDLYTAWSGFE